MADLKMPQAYQDYATQIVDEFESLRSSKSLIDVEVAYDHLKRRVAGAMAVSAAAAKTAPVPEVNRSFRTVVTGNFSDGDPGPFRPFTVDYGMCLFRLELVFERGGEPWAIWDWYTVPRQGDLILMDDGEFMYARVKRVIWTNEIVQERGVVDDKVHHSQKVILEIENVS